MIPPFPDLLGVGLYDGTFPPEPPGPRYTTGPLVWVLVSAGLTVTGCCEPRDTVGALLLRALPTVSLTVERISGPSERALPRNTVGPFSRGRSLPLAPGLAPFSKSGRVADSA